MTDDVIGGDSVLNLTALPALLSFESGNRKMNC